MFSLLLNIYAKWHPEMFNPYLHGCPGGCGAGGKWWGGQGLRWESAVAAVPPAPPRWFVVKHRRWPLAPGPGRETWLYCSCRKCAHSQAYIYMLSVVLRELDTQGGRPERFCGVLASAEGSKIKGKDKTWGGRWTRREEKRSIYCTWKDPFKSYEEKKKEGIKAKRNRNMIQSAYY